MKTNRDFYTPEELSLRFRTNFAKKEVGDPSSLASLFPWELTKDIDYRVRQETSGQILHAANWRSFGGQATGTTHKGAKMFTGSLQPLSANEVIDEKTLFTRRREDIQLDIRNLVEIMAGRIYAELNWQRARALTDGKVTLRGPGGLDLEADFNRDPRLTYTAPNLFTDQAKDPLATIATAVDLYRDVNGISPAGMIVPRKVLSALYRHPIVNKMAINNINSPREVASRSQIELLMSHYGDDMPAIAKFNTEQKIEHDDWTQRETDTRIVSPLFDADKIIFIPALGNAERAGSSDLGSTVVGTPFTFEKLNLTGNRAYGPVARVIEREAPSGLEVFSDALALPIMVNPNLSMAVKVL